MRWLDAFLLAIWCRHNSGHKRVGCSSFMKEQIARVEVIAMSRNITMMKKLMAAVVLTAVASLPVLAAGDAAAGKSKAMTCVACHGMEGKVTVPMYPNLAGQNAMYLEQALKDYKSGGRSGGQAEVMKAYVGNLSEQDISDLAAYYASLKP